MEASQSLFEILRQKRNEIAQESNIEPFKVLHNSVLSEIARKKPSSLAKLAEIKGMGRKRLARYGQFILDTIGRSCPASTQEIVNEKIFTVSEYLDLVNEVLVSQRVIIQGEAGRIDDRGNYTFFTLLDKEKEGVINCFTWNDRLSDFGVELVEGLELQVEGFGRVFKRRGSFTFEVEHIGLVGEGALKQAFERLKKKLQLAGFFAVERKKSIPSYAEKIGLITSTFADAKNDFLTHLGHFGFQIYFYNVRVEGIYAIDDIVSAVRWFNENMAGLEVLVLTRGGGSLEALAAFNSEPVARAIFASKIPIITGIGHENDETIADLVADIYASTPTHAARIISDPWRNASVLVSSYEESLTLVFSGICVNIKDRLSSFETSSTITLRKFLSLQIERVDYLQKELELLFKTIFETYRKTEMLFFGNWVKLLNSLSRVKILIDKIGVSVETEKERWIKSIAGFFDRIEEKLKLADPTSRLKQGYSIVFGRASKVVKSSKQVKIGDRLKLKFYEGGVSSKVEEIQDI